MAFQKSHFVMHIEDTDLSSFFLGLIDHEAKQVLADAHWQNSPCGKQIALKTTQTFLKLSSELYQASIWES